MTNAFDDKKAIAEQTDSKIGLEKPCEGQNASTASTSVCDTDIAQSDYTQRQEGIENDDNKERILAQNATQTYAVSIHGTTKGDKLFTLKSLLIVVLSALSRAIGVQLFLIPNRVILGGATGISSLLELSVRGEFFSACYWIVLINAPLLLLSFVKIGKNWSMRTAINILLTAVFMWVIRITNLANILNTTQEENIVLYAIIGGVLSGLALPFMLNVHGSTGGSDILALMLRNKTKGSTKVMRTILYMDIAVAAVAAAIMKDFNVFVFSLIALLSSEVVGELIYRGYSSALVLEIITDKPEEVSNALMKDLKHGVTSLKIKGMYSNTDKTLVMCVIYKRQIVEARRLIRTIDDKSFAYVLNVKEVVGLGFRNKEEELEEEEK